MARVIFAFDVGFLLSDASQERRRADPTGTVPGARSAWARWDTPPEQMVGPTLVRHCLWATHGTAALCHLGVGSERR